MELLATSVSSWASFVLDLVAVASLQQRPLNFSSDFPWCEAVSIRVMGL